QQRGHAQVGKGKLSQIKSVIGIVCGELFKDLDRLEQTLTGALFVAGVYQGLPQVSIANSQVFAYVAVVFVCTGQPLVNRERQARLLECPSLISQLLYCDAYIGM